MLIKPDSLSQQILLTEEEAIELACSLIKAARKASHGVANHAYESFKLDCFVALKDGSSRQGDVMFTIEGRGA